MFVQCEEDERIVSCRVLKILFDRDEINVEFPDGNCEWYKLSNFESKDFTIEY